MNERLGGESRVSIVGSYELMVFTNWESFSAINFFHIWRPTWGSRDYCEDNKSTIISEPEPAELIESLLNFEKEFYSPIQTTPSITTSENVIVPWHQLTVPQKASPFTIRSNFVVLFYRVEPSSGSGRQWDD